MIKIKKIDILDGIELKEANFNNNSFPVHFHDTYSIGIINKGIENVMVRDNNLIATTQTVVIFNQHELHANRFYNNEDWSYQTVNLNIDVLNFIARKNNFSINKNIVFQNLLKDEHLYNKISNFHQSPIQNPSEQIEEIAAYLLQNYASETQKETGYYPEWKNIIGEVKAFIDQYFANRINIEDIAKKHRKSTFQIIRAFKTHTGLTPIAYLTLVRLNKSKQLLIQGNTLVDTAICCGFFDQSHFTNQFKKYFGVTPKQYCENYSIVRAE